MIRLPWLLFLPFALIASASTLQYSPDGDDSADIAEEPRRNADTPQDNHCVVYADGGSTGIKFEGKQWIEKKKVWVSHGSWNMKDEKVNGVKMWYNFVKDIGNAQCENWRYLFGYTDYYFPTDGAACYKFCPVKTEFEVKNEKGKPTGETEMKITGWAADTKKCSNDKVAKHTIGEVSKENCDEVVSMFWKESLVPGLVKNIFMYTETVKDRNGKIVDQYDVCSSWEIEVLFTGGIRGNCKKYNEDNKLVEKFKNKMNEFLQREKWSSKLAEKLKGLKYQSPDPINAKVLNGAEEEGPLSKLGYRVTMAKKKSDITTPDLMVEFGGASVQFVTPKNPYVVEESSVDAIKAMICKDEKGGKYETIPISSCRMNCTNNEPVSDPALWKWNLDDAGTALSATARNSVKFNFFKCVDLVDAALAKNAEKRETEGTSSIVSTTKTIVDDDLKDGKDEHQVSLITLPEAVVKRWFAADFWYDWNNILGVYTMFVGAKEDLDEGFDTFETISDKTGCDCAAVNPLGEVKPKDDPVAPEGATCKKLCVEMFGDFAKWHARNAEEGLSDQEKASRKKIRETFDKLKKAAGFEAQPDGGMTWRYNGLKVAVVTSVLKKLGVVDEKGQIKGGWEITIGEGGWLEGCMWLREAEHAEPDINSCTKEGIDGDQVNAWIAALKEPEKPKDSRRAASRFVLENED